jgi:hypothetical protein
MSWDAEQKRAAAQHLVRVTVILFAVLFLVLTAMAFSGHADEYSDGAAGRPTNSRGALQQSLEELSEQRQEARRRRKDQRAREQAAEARARLAGEFPMAEGRLEAERGSGEGGDGDGDETDEVGGGARSSALLARVNKVWERDTAHHNQAKGSGSGGSSNIIASPQPQHDGVGFGRGKKKNKKKTQNGGGGAGANEKDAGLSSPRDGPGKEEEGMLNIGDEGPEELERVWKREREAAKLRQEQHAAHEEKSRNAQQPNNADGRLEGVEELKYHHHVVERDDYGEDDDFDAAADADEEEEKKKDGDDAAADADDEGLDDVLNRPEPGSAAFLRGERDWDGHEDATGEFRAASGGGGGHPGGGDPHVKPGTDERAAALLRAREGRAERVKALEAHLRDG